MDLTAEIFRYRECARHVWNTYFQPLQDGWHEYINVEAALFSGLVLEQFHAREGLYRRHPDGYYEAVQVVLTDLPPRVPALCGHEEAGMGTQWKEARFDSIPDLRFVEFFDFANFDAPRDFKWVRGRVVGPAEHGLVGEDVLVEYEYARFVGLT
jgi:hypothetical protein